MSLYSAFETDPNVERQGVNLDFGTFRVRVARAGGANKRFLKLMDQKTKAYKQAIKYDQLEESIAEEVMLEVYADAVILGWETKVEGEWKSGIEARDGSLVPYSAKNVKETLKALPELFSQIQQEASRHTNFRYIQQEADAKNS